MKSSRSPWTLLAVALIAAPAGAADLAGRWGVTAHGEWAEVVSQKAVRQRDSGSVLGAGGMLHYNFSNAWAAGLSFTDITYQDKFRATPAEAVVIRRFPMQGDWGPYGRAGVGLSRALDSKDSFDNAAASFALGVEKYIADRWSVGFEGLYRYISDTGDTRLHAHNVGAGLNISFFFDKAKPRQDPVQAKAEPTPPPAAPVDSDGDGVLDTADRCPGTPAGAKVDDQGCLAKAPEKVTIELNVLFDTDKDEVKPEYYAELKKVSDFMKSYPDTRAEIEGHTDNQGAADHNRDLSQRRADAVRKVLVEQQGVPADRLAAKGYGPDKPIADNGNEDGRKRNRRVVATVSAIQK